MDIIMDIAWILQPEYAYHHRFRYVLFGVICLGLKPQLRIEAFKACCRLLIHFLFDFFSIKAVLETQIIYACFRWT